MEGSFQNAHRERSLTTLRPQTRGLGQCGRSALIGRHLTTTCLLLAVFALSGCRTPSGSQGQFEFMSPDEWFTKSSSEDDGPKAPTTTGKINGDISVPPVPPLVRQDWTPAAPIASRDESEEETVRPTSMWNFLGPRSFWRAKGDPTSPENEKEPQLQPVPGSYE